MALFPSAAANMDGWLWWCLLITVAIPTSLLLVGRVVLGLRLRCQSDQRTVGVFHPYTNAGGGGERVLWSALDCMLRAFPSRTFIVYTGDQVTAAAMIDRARERFAIDLPNGSSQRLRFVKIWSRGLLEASLYPRFTMLGQSIGSAVVGLECLLRHVPAIWLDTTGYAFTYPVASLLAGCTVGCYTHYPTITSDMMDRVSQRRPDYNNPEGIASSVTATQAKLWYYRAFAVAYRIAGRFARVVMVNSSWTRDHVQSLWGAGARVVYPPCNTDDLRQLPLRTQERSREVVSLGQFRPEKNHLLQVTAFARALEVLNVDDAPDVRLVLIGSVRNAEDEARVAAVRRHAELFGIEDRVDIRVNAPFSELRGALGQSICGLHTMWCEHFGIGVVEMMAAGVVTIAHDSGGPRADIVVPHQGQRTGFLASSADSYAVAIAAVLMAHGVPPVAEPHASQRSTVEAATAVARQSDLSAIAAAARAHAATFSDAAFQRGFVASMERLLGAPDSHWQA